MKHKCFLFLFTVSVITSEIPKGYDEFFEFKEPEIQYSDFGTPIVPTYSEIQCAAHQCSCPQSITSKLSEDMCPRIQDCCSKDWSKKDDWLGYGVFCSALKKEWGKGLLSISALSNTVWLGSITLTVGFMGTMLIKEPATNAIVTLIGSMAQTLYETAGCNYNHGYYLASFGVEVNGLMARNILWRKESVRHFLTPLDSDSSGLGILSAFRICGIPTLSSVISNIVLAPLSFHKMTDAMKYASKTVSWITKILTQLLGGLPQIGASAIAQTSIADETWNDIWQNTNYGENHHLQKALHILVFVIRKIGYAMRRLKTVLEGLLDDVIKFVLKKTEGTFLHKLVEAIEYVFNKWFIHGWFDKKGLSTPNEIPEDNPNQFDEVIRILKQFKKRTLYLVNHLYCNCFKEKDKDVMKRSKYCRPGTPESMEYHWYFSPDEIHDTKKLEILTTKMWGKVMGPYVSSWETIRDCFRKMKPMQRELIMVKVGGLLGKLNAEHANIPPVLKFENGEGPFVNVFWSCPNNHDPKYAMCQTYHSNEDDSFLKIEVSDKIPELCQAKTEEPKEIRRRFGL